MLSTFALVVHFGTALVSRCALEWLIAQYALGLLLQGAGSHLLLDERALWTKTGQYPAWFEC